MAVSDKKRQKRLLKGIRQAVKLMGKAVDEVVRKIAEMERLEKALKILNKKH